MPESPAGVLAERIPERGFPDDDAALDAWLGWVGDAGVSLYDAQEEAVLELFSGHHVVLKTPTGSGKSLVAEALHFRAFAWARRSVYTAPIKALVSEKFFALCDTFGAEHVGLMTGDGAINRDAPIVCCTAEILSKMALRHGEQTPFAAVVMDEFHYYGDRDRGMAWQVPLLTMPHAQFLLMSATLGDTEAIEADLTERTGHDAVEVYSGDRPVPLTFRYAETPAHATLDNLVRQGHAPVYAVHFTQRAAADLAQALMSAQHADKEHKARVAAAVKGFRFDSPYGPTVRRTLLHGVGLHHAGLLPKYRLLTEKLAQRGLLRVICGTDTLGVGINVPIRTVLFTQLCKFDGEKVGLLTAREFHQIAGRAGRKGFDEEGLVVAQAPEWIIENKRLQAAADAGTRNKKKFVKRKPPDRGYKHWDEATFERLQAARPSALRSRFRVDHGLVLALLQNAEGTGVDGMTALDELIDRSHEGKRSKERLRTSGRALLDDLIRAGVVQPELDGAMPLRAGLQEDFSLFHSLSLFLLHALELLEPEDPDYALDVLTLVESILEHPRVVLRAQVHREKGIRVAELKAQGVPYEERMEALEDITWPKPRAAWIYATFEAYAEQHPWVGADAIRPKTVAREMFEAYASFANTVKGLRLERSEGVLLRYLSQVYRTLLQGVPESARTPDLDDAIGFLRALLARVDDSLITEWERLVSGEPSAPERPTDASSDKRAFTARIRAELHAVVRALSREDWEEAAACVRQTPGAEFPAAAFKDALRPYLEEVDRVRFDGAARQAWNTLVKPDGPLRWRVSQILVDDEELGWSIDGVVDLSDDRNPSGPLVEIEQIGG